MAPATSSQISEQAVGSCSADQSTLIENFADLRSTTENSDASIRSHHYPHYNLPYRGLPAEIRLQIWRLIMPSALEAIWDHLKWRNCKNKWKLHQGPYVVTEPQDNTSYILNAPAASKGQSWRLDCLNQRYLEISKLPPLMTTFAIFHVNKTVQEEACKVLQWLRPHLMLTDIDRAEMQSLLSCLSPCASLAIFDKLTITDIYYDDGRPCHDDNSKHIGSCSAIELWRQAAARLRVNELCLKFFNKLDLWSYEDVLQKMERSFELRTVSMDAVALVLRGAVQQLQLVIRYDGALESRHGDPIPWTAKLKDALHLESLPLDQFERLDIRCSMDELAFRHRGGSCLAGENGFVVLISLETETT